MFSRSRALGYAVGLAFALAASGVAAQVKANKNPVQKAGKYAVELRVPAEGLYAGEETDVEFRITDTSQDDPVQGAPPVVNAKITADISMPSMPSMPRQKPKTHSEGVPGDYGVILSFPHGGEYLIDFAITPPGGQPFTVSFKVAVQDADLTGKRKPKPQPYMLEVKSSPATPRAGEPAELTIVVRSRETKQPVTDFDVVHERLIHFIVVSRDLSRFSHEHPESGAGGMFALRYTFPTGGEYRLFADVAPKGAGAQVLVQPIKVAGPVPASTVGAKPSPSSETVISGMKVAIKADPRGIPSGRTLPVTFSVSDEKGGTPVTDIQPWLGAIAHLILIHEDGATFVHSHPDETNPNNGKDGQMTFLARFPKPGVYRGWLQFQRGGTVQTASFVLQAAAKRPANGVARD